MSLVGKTIPRRLHRFTSFSIVTAFLRDTVASSFAFVADKVPPAVLVSAEPDNFGIEAAVFDFENRDGARNTDEVAWQRGAARIHHHRRAIPNHAFDMTMALHDDID